MNRRSIFKLLACAVAASAMEVCGWIPAPSFRRVSDPICLADIRSSFALKGQLKACIDKLVSGLPEGDRFFLRWENVYDKSCNPFRSIGHFVAVPREDADEARIVLDEAGFLMDARNHA